MYRKTRSKIGSKNINNDTNSNKNNKNEPNQTWSVANAEAAKMFPNPRIRSLKFDSNNNNNSLATDLDLEAPPLPSISDTKAHHNASNRKQKGYNINIRSHRTNDSILNNFNNNRSNRQTRMQNSNSSRVKSSNFNDVESIFDDDIDAIDGFGTNQILPTSTASQAGAKYLIDQYKGWAGNLVQTVSTHSMMPMLPAKAKLINDWLQRVLQSPVKLC